MKNVFKSKLSIVIKIVALLLPFFLIQFAYSDQTPDLGTFAENVSGFFGDFAQLVAALIFVIGFGFCVGALIKYKAHRDNPQYITLSTPVTLLIVGIIFLLLGALLIYQGKSIFGPSF